MIKLNNYIIEAWNGVKKQSLKADIEAWCDEMGIEEYTINYKGEILRSKFNAYFCEDNI